MKKIAWLFFMLFYANLAHAAGPICTLRKPPEKIEDLLKNLFCVAQKSDVLEKGFFINDEALWGVTAGRTFTRDYPLDSNLESTHVTWFPEEIIPNTDDLFRNRLGIEIHKRAKPFSFDIRVSNIHKAHLHFSAIEKIFGANWKSPNEPIMPELVSPLNPPLPKAMDAHAYERMEYHFVTSSSAKGTMYMTFNEKGICDSFSISVEDEQSEAMSRAPIPPTPPISELFKKSKFSLKEGH